MSANSPSDDSETKKSVSEKPSAEEGEEKRAQWDNQVQFILTAIGLAVGLGNIWRFPAMAYENGGSAFMIPYILCGIFFGLPMVYAEMTIGQFSRSGPGKAFGRYAYGFQGVGWMMALISLTVAIYYCVIIAWAGVYLGWVVSGQSWKWTECGNSWNTGYCVSQKNQADCKNSTTPYFFNDTCWEKPSPMAVQPAEEFFVNYLTVRGESITSIGGVIWPVFGSLLFMWILTCATLIKGIEIMGKMSYVTVPLPYIVVVILFFRGVTLENAGAGVSYLFTPDWNKLLNHETWANALKQLMFSMNIGYGGLISLSSYSKPSNNHFRDTLIVIFGDTLMSIIGGVAVFSVLGYLSKMTGRPISEVVQSGTSLAFIAYPEAMASMPVHYIWEFLFFIMLFFLGISTEVALVETFTGCVYDVFPKLKKTSSTWVTMIVCAGCLAAGSFMCTYASWYWFQIYDSFTGSTTACLVSALEVILFTVYGWKNIKQDLAEMRGQPRCGGVCRWFGPQSPLLALSWATICPLLALIVMALTLLREFIPFQVVQGRASDAADVLYVYPMWAEVLGWLLNLGPAIAIPAFFFYRCVENKSIGRPFHYLLRPNKELRSAKRYYKEKGLAHPDEFEEKKEKASGRSKRRSRSQSKSSKRTTRSWKSSMKSTSESKRSSAKNISV